MRPEGGGQEGLNEVIRQLIALIIEFRSMLNAFHAALSVLKQLEMALPESEAATAAPASAPLPPSLHGY